MQIPFVDLKKQYRTIREDVNTEIVRALDGMQLFLGPNIQAFDADFAHYCGAEYGIGVGSGTEALHLALLACGVAPGDEVITVSNTFIATFEAIALTGASPVFVDVNPQTYNIDPDQIEKVITDKTKVILPVHLYGQPADMDPVLNLARSYNLKVIEDACQAHGAEYKGRRAGSLGDAGCFSFYYSKNLGAYGEAGMVVTSNVDIAEKCKMLRNHGQNVRYYHSVLGVNSRIDEIQAAVLRIKLPYLDEWNEKRRRLAAIYESNLSSSVVKPVTMPGASHVYHLYVIRIPNRDRLQSHLTDCGIATGIHYPVPIHVQEAYREYCGRDAVSLPLTEKLVGEILSLPMYPELTDEEAIYVCNCVNEFV